MNFKKLSKGVSLTLILFIAVFSVSNYFISVNAAQKVKSTSVTLNVTKATINVGGVLSLQGTMTPLHSTDTLKWTSKDKTIAKVTKQGVITGVKEGITTITVETSSGKKTTCKITVIKNWTEKAVRQLIEENTIDEVKIKEIVAQSSISEEKIRELIEEVTKNISNNYTTINQNTLSQSEFNKMYDNKLNSPISDGSSISCYPRGEFEWLTTDVYGVTGSAIKISINSMNATIKNNDFEAISNSIEADKGYTKYTSTVSLMGIVCQDTPLVPNETISIIVSAMSNNVSIGAYHGTATINNNKSFTVVIPINTNSTVDEVIFNKSMIYDPNDY